jgi:2-phosphoglycerate kinase
MEGTSLIVEGAHIVPGFMDPTAWEDRALVVMAILTVDEEDVHRSHFATRAADHAGRSAARYLEQFDNIRRVQRYIKSQALSHGVPIIGNFSFDRSLAAVIDLVMERATERAAGHRARVGSPIEGGIL